MMNLGHYPKQTTLQSINQRASLDALNHLLPPDQFIFRDERVDDYGIDGSLELVVGARVTNYISFW